MYKSYTIQWVVFFALVEYKKGERTRVRPRAGSRRRESTASHSITKVVIVESASTASSIRNGTSRKGWSEHCERNHLGSTKFINDTRSNGSCFLHWWSIRRGSEPGFVRAQGAEGERARRPIPPLR